MITNIVRRVSLVAAVVAVSLVAGVGSASATPADWPESEPFTGLDTLLFLLIIPVGVAAVIAFLAWFPDLVKSGRKSTEIVAVNSDGDQEG